MSNTKFETIKCPTCGAEYLPVELFIPDAFFGKPIHIERNEEHKIIDIVGPAMNTNEQYTCNYCNVPFKISTKIQFGTKAETKFDFNEEYTTSLKKQSLFLNEE